MSQLGEIEFLYLNGMDVSIMTEQLPESPVTAVCEALEQVGFDKDEIYASLNMMNQNGIRFVKE